MKYLYVYISSSAYEQSNILPDEDALQQIDDGELDVIRVENGEFQKAIISGDSDDGFVIDSWEKVSLG